ncbi:hypothetical protein TNCV_4080581 [Trichonephila clavipes]|nr:hypothetical protein TNCV_4080581 [Trichonephila clavipes]
MNTEIWKLSTLLPSPREANWSHSLLNPASNQRATSKLSAKPKNSKFFPQIQMKNHSHTSRIPSFNQSPSCDSAERKTPLSPSPASKTYHDIGLRTVLQPRCPNRNAYSTPIRALFFCSCLFPIM